MIRYVQKCEQLIACSWDSALVSYLSQQNPLALVLWTKQWPLLSDGLACYMPQCSRYKVNVMVWYCIVCKVTLLCAIWIACTVQCAISFIVSVQCVQCVQFVQCVISFTASELNCDGMRAARNNSFHIQELQRLANICFAPSRNGAEEFLG